MDIEEQPVEATPIAHEAPKALDLPTAIQNVLKSSLIHGKLFRGLRECAKALDRNEAALCILADSCEEESYKKLVETLCAHRNVPILRVESAEDLGQWAGLCQIDKDGQPRKIVNCSCVVIKEVGTDIQSYEFIAKHIKSQA
ncbi:putative 60S ribosomal protein L10a-1 [Monocercomonoides exilis]|uniref:putative 60S ribosomal protein L10a-1 n=1 Tax=Monocercomonoides exilis TaxID=2049356 RepID=UPI00355AB34F|nr:putative 60S ribosomal protein L10a-1 [Monocercomonoides exilis]|eukprot:MONOS_2477.1-p1 / transcript=MONOS_2477.1 / gene=MONOS_2477 / organism=Monocercomonoides_exilis_PA203 / gene_product=60S ribosomal protein L10a-1 / transcript_product=60S ribosomal protein L10a-1 / location=Mono_scaffold00051:111930-112410(+) / protein_length=142 / sequence_SO=supercontig / SO=protein_coding / is_pseudo=false